MREIVLDTETTGLDPYQGDRVVEIGCIELFNGIPTGQTFHRYVNPERDMPPEAYAVHGLTEEFLATHPPSDNLTSHSRSFRRPRHLRQRFGRAFKALLPELSAIRPNAAAAKLFIVAQKISPCSKPCRHPNDVVGNARS